MSTFFAFLIIVDIDTGLKWLFDTFDNGNKLFALLFHQINIHRHFFLFGFPKFIDCNSGRSKIISILLCLLQIIVGNDDPGILLCLQFYAFFHSLIIVIDYSGLYAITY